MDGSKIVLLRLGHRIERDKRASTHLFLAARALGVYESLYSGKRDEKMENNIKKVNASWGGAFELRYIANWRKTVYEWKRKDGEVIHLTMYGLPLQEVISDIKTSVKSKLIIVGGPKVPSNVYELADWNVSVTSQPHSEISSLAIFLHEFYGGSELSKIFENARMKIIPQERGKKIMKL